MEKLSELSKPTACRNKHTGRTFNATENTEPQIYESLYSQEYVSALTQRAERLDSMLTESLQALKEAEQRIVELESANKSQDDHINQQQDRIESLENKNSDLGQDLGVAEKLLEDRLEKWQELASNQLIKINELRDKLATPVRLPEAHNTLFRQHIRSDYKSLQAFKADEVIAALREQGFTVEGDE